jgi:hypothetical protein
MDEEVDFYVKGSDKTIFFTPSCITFALANRKERPAGRDLFGIERRESHEEPGQSDDAVGRWVVKMEFVGANPDVEPRGEERQEAIFSYFKGKPEDWMAGIPTYSRIVYEELWPGIDLVYSGTVNKLKYDFIVKPGADPQKIRFDLSGASDVVLAKSGVLEVNTPLGGFEDERPTAFQEIDGNRVDVPVAYALDRSESGDSYSLGFEVGAYDPRETLMIDPVVLVYCGYIGGKDIDGCSGIVVDKQGNAYLTGTTSSSEADGFPVKVGPDLTFNGGTWGDAYVAKVAASGASLIYCGFIGGTKGDSGGGIDVDGQGNAYITGVTRSSETEAFPLMIGPGLSHGGIGDAFIAKVAASGTHLLYCGYIGGEENDVGNGIVVDDLGNAYVAGRTESCQTTFPVFIGPDLTYNGNGDTFIAKVTAIGAKLDYCGYIGGAENDVCASVVVDREENAYIAGRTASNQESFPVLVGPDLTYNRGRKWGRCEWNGYGWSRVCVHYRINLFQRTRRFSGPGWSGSDL